MLGLLVALINVFPEILSALREDHPLTAQVLATLPQHGASEVALEELRRRAVQR